MRYRNPVTEPSKTAAIAIYGPPQPNFAEVLVICAKSVRICPDLDNAIAKIRRYLVAVLKSLRLHYWMSKETQNTTIFAHSCHFWVINGHFDDVLVVSRDFKLITFVPSAL